MSKSRCVNVCTSGDTLVDSSTRGYSHSHGNMSVRNVN